MGTSCWALLSDLFCVLISRYSITITLINLPSLILAAMTRMRIMMMRQLTRVIFLRLFSVWDTQPPGARLARLSSPEITPSTSGSGARPESEKRHLIWESFERRYWDLCLALNLFRWQPFIDFNLSILVTRHWRSPFYANWKVHRDREPNRGGNDF